MLLTSKNLSEIKYKTKRVKLEKADAEINVALIPVSLVNEARSAGEEGKEELGIKILMASVVDDNGDSVFAAESFKGLPLAVQSEITEAVFEYNGLTDAEELEKN